VTDLISAVSAPTSGESHLDHLLVSDTFYSNTIFVRPVLHSDPMAIVAYTGEVKINQLKQKHVHVSPTQHATFFADLSRLGPTQCNFSIPRSRGAISKPLLMCSMTVLQLFLTNTIQSD